MAATAMFDRGVGALRAALPRLPHVRFSPDITGVELYVCPLCLSGFTRDQLAQLTREHAPPRSLGGGVVALTCVSCNQGASGAQADAVHRSRWQQFADHEPGVARTVRITDSHGARVTAEIEHRDDGGFVIATDPERSDPVQYKALHLGLSAAPGQRKTLTLEGDVGYRQNHARASDLRDAYLAAFALLGYRYVLWPDLDEVRRQVEAVDPDNRHFMRTDQFGPDFRGVLVLREPIEFVCVIGGGGRCTFLPWPARLDEFMVWLDELSNSGAGISSRVGGEVHPWPKGMPMLLDYTRPT